MEPQPHIKEEEASDEELDCTDSEKAQADVHNENAKNMDPQERVRERATRRQHLADARDQLAEGTPTPDMIVQAMTQANEHFAGLQDIGMSGQDMVDDSSHVASIASLLRNMTDCALSGLAKKTFKLDAFFQNLKAKAFNPPDREDFDGNELLNVENENKVIRIKVEAGEDVKPHLTEREWKQIARSVDSSFPLSLEMSYLLADFDHKNDAAVPADKKVRKARVKEEREEVVCLTQKADDELENIGQTVSRELDHVSRCLKRALRENDSVSFYHFVLNPHSFSASVENVFHVSFLLSNCLFRMDIDDSGLPVLSKTSKMEREFLERPEAACYQAILTLNKHLWKGFVNVLHITESMIPRLEREKMENEL